MVRRRVDLPEPEGPRTTVTSPAADVEIDAAQDVQGAEVLVDGADLDLGGGGGLAPGGRIDGDGAHRTLPFA